MPVVDIVTVELFKALLLHGPQTAEQLKDAILVVEYIASLPRANQITPASITKALRSHEREEFVARRGFINNQPVFMLTGKGKRFAKVCAEEPKDRKKAGRTFVVRVVREHKDFENPFVECLRYAGHVQVHEESEMVFDIVPPKGLDSRAWATNVAGKMSSYGYNAVVAPAWGE